MLPRPDLVVDEVEANVLAEVLPIVDEALIADHIDLPDRSGADDSDRQPKVAGDSDDVTLQILLAVRLQAVVEDDVVGRAVAVTLLHRLEKNLAGELLRNRAGVRDMGREVVRRGLNTELVALGPGVPNIARRLITARR